jgi:predicted ATPase
VGETPKLLPVWQGLWAFAFLRGNLQSAQELAERSLHHAQREDDSASLVGAHWLLGTTLLFVGAFAPSLAHMEQGIALYDVHPGRPLRILQDPGIGCRIYAAASLIYLGYLDRAAQRIQEALGLARNLSHPYSLVWGQSYAALLANVRGEPQAAQQYAETEIALATEQHFALWIAFGTIQRGIALMRQEQTQEGLQQIAQGTAAWRATGALLGVPQWFTFLAEAYGKSAQPEKGLSVLDEALAHVHQTGERFFEAELHRLRGSLPLQQSSDNSAEAETSFHRALDIARHQQAKSLELRAATSLVTLWQSQGKRQDAYDLLAPVYGWFTEGFDTADLKDAKTLLN